MHVSGLQAGSGVSRDTSVTVNMIRTNEDAGHGPLMSEVHGVSSTSLIRRKETIALTKTYGSVSLTSLLRVEKRKLIAKVFSHSR